ncbi:unnamed protein product [Echinostoma caproni]|uniref:Cytochrome P450 n=1 Tax=Echinostoma caproni TaxID=27848 RepID=A0A183AHY1_9TREM|nr:unnamed protein product [Echinostoma caproni]
MDSRLMGPVLQQHIRRVIGTLGDCYDGPIRVIRRADDEIISTRFPHLMTTENELMLWNFLSVSAAEQRQVLRELDVTSTQLEPLVVEELRAELLGKERNADSDQTPVVPVPLTGLYPSALGSKIMDPVFLDRTAQFSPGFYTTRSPPALPHCLYEAIRQL